MRKRDETIWADCLEQDGIRGLANRDLSLRRATEVGMALAEVIRSEHPGERPAVVIGRDTRLSGDMLQSALAGGLMAGGADVVLLGVIPTPAVAYLTVQKKAGRRARLFPPPTIPMNSTASRSSDRGATS